MTFLSALRHALPTFAPGSTRAAATPPVTPPCSPDTPSDTSPATAPRRSRVLRIGALTTTLLLVAGGAFAVANAPQDGDPRRRLGGVPLSYWRRRHHAAGHRSGGRGHPGPACVVRRRGRHGRRLGSAG